MRRAMVIGLAAVATMMMAGCGGGDIGDPEGASNVGGQDTVSGFLLDENTDTVTRGRLGTADGQLSFFAISQETAVTILMVRMNGKTFDVTLDGSVTIDGHGAVLSAADRALLQTLVDELTSRFTTATMPSRIESLVSLGSYLSVAPVGYVHARSVTGAPVGTLAAAASGVICLTKGTTVTAVYDMGKAGAGKSQAVLVGSNWGRNAANTGGNYSCMGGCGAGCPYSGKTKYTQDCLNHDTCSHNENAHGAGGDVNCGDEFTAASDDYMSSACTAQ